jgi:hypothetical protein
MPSAVHVNEGVSRSVYLLASVTRNAINRSRKRPTYIPDDCAVVGCALTAVAALVLMMLAGAAKADQSDFVFHDLIAGQVSGPCAPHTN